MTHHVADLGNTRAHPTICFFFFFNDTATTEIYTLSLHDALPICAGRARGPLRPRDPGRAGAQRRRRCRGRRPAAHGDRKSTRLNSSHLVISYAVFCLKKKKKHCGRRRVTSVSVLLDRCTTLMKLA